MKTIYLCGPIHGCDDLQARGWRTHVMEALGTRYVFLDPMRRDYRGRERGNWREIVAADLDDIQNSDYTLALCDRPSWGTAMEIFAAARLFRKPTILVGGNDSPWLEVHAAYRVTSIAEAIQMLLDWEAF